MKVTVVLNVGESVNAHNGDGSGGVSTAGLKRTLRTRDAVALIVGIVVGAGIFRAPSLVAANAGSEAGMLLAWIIGGVVSLAGALCYAELASAYPHPGGEFHFLSRAFGKKLGFLFAWARLTIIPTGSVALIAFVFGDYASHVVRLGENSSSVYATLAVVLLTGLNVLGIQHGKQTQNLLTAAEVLGVLIIIVVGLGLVSPLTAMAAEPVPDSGGTSESPRASQGAWGLAMVFVLLTYGGWNDAAYISAEVKGRRRGMVRVLLWSISLITVLYLLINLAYLRGLGLEGIARSDAVASDLMRSALGGWGEMAVAILIAVSALTSANATILMGARGNYALGRDYPLLSALGQWDVKGGTPANALIVQGAIILALIILGTITRSGFETMVEYTAPVFWFFVFLTGTSLFVLRMRAPDDHRPFRVPLYPLTPILFCCASGYLLYSSLVYTGIGALVGVAVLVIGGIVLAIVTAMHRNDRPPT